MLVVELDDLECLCVMAAIVSMPMVVLVDSSITTNEVLGEASLFRCVINLMNAWS